MTNFILQALGLSVFRGSLRPFVEQSAGVTDRIQLGWYTGMDMGCDMGMGC